MTDGTGRTFRDLSRQKLGDRTEGDTRQARVGNREFGRWLGDMCTEMRKEGLTEARVMLRTQGHAMAVKIEEKTDPDGSKRFRISCYDPNLTGNHKVVEAPSPESLHAHCLNDFIKTKYYAKHPDDAVVTAYCQEVELPGISRRPLAYVGFDDPAVPLRTNAVEALIGQLGFSLQLDFVNRSLKEIAALMKQRGLTGAQAAAAIPKVFFAGHTYMGLGLAQDMASEITKYAETLKSLGITGEMAIPLMKAVYGPRREQARTGIAAALAADGGLAIVAYAEALKSLGITGRSAIPLMEKVPGRGIPFGELPDVASLPDPVSDAPSDGWRLDAAPRMRGLEGYARAVALLEIPPPAR